MLHLEDDPADAELIRAKIEAVGLACRISRVQTRDEFDHALKRGGYDIILADYRLPMYDGLSALRLTLESCPEVPFIFVSGTMGEEAAIEALTQGATDYVLKRNLSRLAPAVQRALLEVENRRERVQAQKMESVGRLAGGVAHDFNNMLGVITGHAELALDQLEPDNPLFGSLKEIFNAAKRSAGLTRQLLAFARRQVVAPKVLDLNRTVEGMLKMLRRLMGEDIDLVWLPDADLWPVKMDPAQIDQILANLCVNARDAIADGGRITIETGMTTLEAAYCADHAGFVPGDFVVMTVSDDGLGMDKATIDKIFEPFFTTKERGKGTGLGMAMVYGIVKQNDGFINVYSEPGYGTTFRICLPRHVVTDEPAPKKRAATAIIRGQETILLVEDEPAILESTRLMLARLGYQVFAAATPDEALTIAGEHPGEIQLLITDVIMPGMNGRELAKRMLALSPATHYLFMSGYTEDVIAHHAVLDEGIHFIQKPFSLKVLATKVREVLDEKPENTD
jgi:signal transduction histidine kinase